MIDDFQTVTIPWKCQVCGHGMGTVTRSLPWDYHPDCALSVRNQVRCGLHRTWFAWKPNMNALYWLRQEKYVQVGGRKD